MGIVGRDYKDGGFHAPLSDEAKAEIALDAEARKARQLAAQKEKDDREKWLKFIGGRDEPLTPMQALRNEWGYNEIHGIDGFGRPDNNIE